MDTLSAVLDRAGEPINPEFRPFGAPEPRKPVEGSFDVPADALARLAAAIAAPPDDEPAEEAAPSQQAAPVAAVGDVAAEHLEAAFQAAADKAGEAFDKSIVMLADRLETLRAAKTECMQAILDEAKYVLKLTRESAAMADNAMRLHADATKQLANGGTHQ